MTIAFHDNLKVSNFVCLFILLWNETENPPILLNIFTTQNVVKGIFQMRKVRFITHCLSDCWSSLELRNQSFKNTCTFSGENISFKILLLFLFNRVLKVSDSFNCDFYLSPILQFSLWLLSGGYRGNILVQGFSPEEIHLFGVYWQASFWETFL